MEHTGLNLAEDLMLFGVLLIYNHCFKSIYILTWSCCTLTFSHVDVKAGKLG